MEYEKMLTKGALKSIKNNEWVERPVMQVIGVDKMPSRNECYILTVSDGENRNSVWITFILNSMVSSGKLTKFSLIKINNYVTSNLIDPSTQPIQAIILSDVVVIVPGSIIHKTIGNPQRFSNDVEPIFGMEASASTAQVNEDYSELDRTKELEWRSLIERGLHSRLLTKGALQSILCNANVKCPIMQVLSILLLKNAITGFSIYRLIISDGQHHYSLVSLDRRLNSLITCGHLKEYSIIYIKSYAVVNVTDSSHRNWQLIVLTDLVCLFVCPGEVIGNPQPAKGNSGQEVANSYLDITNGSDSIDHEMDNLLHNLDMLHMF
ncbi:uncharacterized protein LOC111027478 [Myzus persicae]|uniref:uncharacterized protein LOC111027478 n=1 Tax=Myzus persicae TaxID=13164 RepID=UPI000B939CDB|nr:uncharacterized protein LOC111027478 [Myzus persicae]